MKLGLSEEELEFYSRQIVLSNMGYDGQLKLKRSKVCLVGLGGLGSTAATLLASMGVGHLRLVDRDIVEASNMQRQHLYGTQLLGYPKVEAAEKRLTDLNPHIKIEPLPYSLNIDNAEDVLRGVDVVVDGLDRMKPRYVINRTCVKLKIPYVFGAAITTYGNVSTIIPGETACLECFLGNIDDEALPTCAAVGVHPATPNIIASIEVAEAIKILLGETPRLANRLLYCDLEYADFNEVKLSRSDRCSVCGSNPTAPLRPLRRDLVEEVYGRQGRKVFIVTPKKDLDLNIKDVYDVAQKNRFNVEKKTRLSVTFSQNDEKVSILKSGVMIFEGVKDRKQVVKNFKVIQQDLRIDQADIE
jgi:molybdopterin/thiamine biosynthesis adenylyltransferase